MWNFFTKASSFECPFRYRNQSYHLRRPLRSSSHREGTGNGDQADSESHRSSFIRRQQSVGGARGSERQQVKCDVDRA